jgi:hypothetical protein
MNTRLSRWLLQTKVQNLKKAREKLLVETLPGVRLRRIRNRVYVVVYTQELGNPEISELAQIFHLYPEAVLDALLRNMAAVRALHRDECRGIDEDFPGFDKARQDLKDRAFTLAYNDSRRVWCSGNAFLKWQLNLEKNEYVLLPYSPEFHEVLRKRQRQAYIRTLTPSFEGLEQQLEKIRKTVNDLDLNIGVFTKLVQSAKEPINRLKALDGLLGVLLSDNGSKDPGSTESSDREAVEELRKKIQVLQKEAYELMMNNPPNYPNLVSERNQIARDLMMLVEDSELERNIDILMKNLGVAPPELKLKTEDTLRQAATVLYLSPEAETFFERHVNPLIDMVASKPFDTEGLNAPEHPEFERAVKLPPLPPPSKTRSVFVRIADAYGAVWSYTVSSTPGPASFFEGIVELSAPWIMGKIISTRGKTRSELAAKWAGRLYRFLVNSAGLKPTEQVNLIKAIDNGDLRGLKGEWSGNWMPQALRAFQAVGACVCFIVAVTENDANTLRYWARIVDTGSTTLGGLAVFLSKYSIWLESRVVQSIGGKALGFVGGLASIVAGYETFREEAKKNDDVGQYIALGGVIGGGVQVGALAGIATWIIITGAETAPVGGLWLATAGAIIGAGAATIAYVRQITTERSNQIFQAYLNAFGDCREYKNATKNLDDPDQHSLKTAFETVQNDHTGEDLLWYANPETSSDLLYFGFPVEAIAQIVNEDEKVVIDCTLMAFVETKSWREESENEYLENVAKRLDSERQYIKDRLESMGASWQANLGTFAKP